MVEQAMSKQLKLLNVICVVGAIFFLAMIVVTAVTSGDILTIDALFMMTFCLLMAIVFAASPLMYLKSEGKLPLPGMKRVKSASSEESVSEPVASAHHPVVHEEIHFSGTNGLFAKIWVVLVVLTVLEIFLAYITMPIHLMLTVLIGLSIIKAALIVAYFMHLKFERLSLILSLVPMLIICICLLFIFFPDSFRSSNLRYKYQEQAPVAPPEVEEP
jgi:cytochrome c oxidase subunit 4